MFIGKYNKSVILTYLGVAIAVTGSYLALIKDLPRYGVLCLILAGICDLFDGVIARLTDRDVVSQAFGIQIDSLADMVSFVFLPICICYSLGLVSWLHLALYIVYTLTAVVRLAFFNTIVTKSDPQPLAHYRGLPVTYISFILPLLWLLVLVVDPLYVKIAYTVALALCSFFFVLDFKLPKPKGLFYIFFPLLAVIVIIVLLSAG